eukprot:8012901-Alexandrium_andersonii.AAC.1
MRRATTAKPGPCDEARRRQALSPSSPTHTLLTRLMQTAWPFDEAGPLCPTPLRSWSQGNPKRRACRASSWPNNVGKW